MDGSCEHNTAWMTITRDEFSRLLEGSCPECKIPAERGDDGMATCPCCQIAWRVEGFTAFVRAPFMVVDDDGRPLDGASTGRTATGGGPT